MNTFNKVSIINATKKNKVMDTEMEHQNTNLLLDVPDEILKVYYHYLDFKSYLHFLGVCKHISKDGTKQRIFRKSVDALGSILSQVQDRLIHMQRTFSSEKGSNMLLSCLLRKLIFASATNDEMIQHSTSIAQTQCLEEYNSLLMRCLEEFDMTIVQFNNNLENAQFEYRGFNIIGIHTNERHMLNAFKSILQETYFNKPFVSHFYISYDAVHIEINCDDHDIMFDVHHQDNDGNWVFLLDIVKLWMETIDNGNNVDNDDVILLAKSRDVGIDISEKWLSWSRHNEHAVSVIAELLLKFMPNDSFFKGAEKVNVEIWNDTLEDNWIFAIVAREHLQCSKYEETILSFTHSMLEEYDNQQIIIMDE
jgi:hypothetical protein